ncbi:MAG: protein-glutamate O-methyltransferase CheR [Nitrospiraceae bacterium]|nr:protein-glutamate O-methyltransferase CheR [Nitrospiraceae bacterium]
MPEKEIKLPEHEFRLLSDLIRNYCGISFDESSKFLLEKRLARRLEQRHLDNFRDYYRLLLYDRDRAEELTAVLDLITVNETYFFREQSQLQAFSDEIIPEVLASGPYGRKFRIWSAGCSSGEEPYTLAMLLLEKGIPANGLEVEIIASDINQRVLAAARRGVYRKNSFRTTQEYYIKKYFEREDENTMRIKDEVKRNVTFSCINLLDSGKMGLVGKVDVIFCRNVLIYFGQDARKAVVGGFFERLSDKGFLLLGHAESLMSITSSFSLRHLKNDMVYQKPHKSAPGYEAGAMPGFLRERTK